MGTFTSAIKIISCHLYDFADFGDVNICKLQVLYARENLACVDQVFTLELTKVRLGALAVPPEAMYLILCIGQTIKSFHYFVKPSPTLLSWANSKAVAMERHAACRSLLEGYLPFLALAYWFGIWGMVVIDSSYWIIFKLNSGKRNSDSWGKSRECLVGQLPISHEK